MPVTATRRQLLLGGLGWISTACASSRAATPVASSDARASFAAIERRIGGRLGVMVIDTGTNAELAHRADERFAMCSTFKWVLAAAILARVDDGEVSLQDVLSYGEGDLLEYAPVTRARVDEGAMSVGALAEAAVTLSDNTAANLLLERIGGPAGLTQYVRSLGDPVTRLDRNEPTLNSNEPDDPRDTTSPRAMARLMRTVLCGDALSPAGRERLLGWLRACETGTNNLRAGLPPAWSVGDKTGTGARGAVNDVAIAVPPGRAPIVIAAYISESTSTLDELRAAHADIARVVARQL
jgi:beta-lactamase class A